MRKELAHFHLGEALGGSQEWFLDPFMKLGGCGAVTACDTCIWLAREFGAEWLYPFDLQNLCRREYLHFGRMMKPYLRPRAGGINRLEKYMRGFNAYLRGREEWRISASGEGPDGSVPKHLRIDGLSGQESADTAWDAVERQIDGGFPVPVLNLRHQDQRLKDFVWHWFLLCGYTDEGDVEILNPKEPDATPGTMLTPAAGNADGTTPARCTGPARYVKIVTYGESAWVDFDGLWDTGHEEKGGLILYRWE